MLVASASAQRATETTISRTDITSMRIIIHLTDLSFLAPNGGVAGGGGGAL